MTRINWPRIGLAAVLALSASGVVAEAPEVSVYVARDGNDANAGTQSQPLATLEAAKQRVRQIRSEQGAVKVTVTIGAGDYLLPESFKLGPSDSGLPGAEVVYAAAPGEAVRLIGGRAVPLSRFEPVVDPQILDRLDPSARGKVTSLDLKAEGFARTGPYPDRFKGSGGIIQVFFNGRRMPISRWPAEGYATIQEVVDSGIEPTPRGGVFRYRGDRPSRWTVAAQQGGVWLFGFWRVPWDASAVKVAHIDTQARTITHAAAIPLGIGSKYTPLVNGTRKGDGKEPWCAVNLIEEITQPGHWAVDFSSGRLYFWAPSDDTGVAAQVVIADHDAAVIDLSGATDVTLERLIVEGGLGDLVSIKNGSRITVAGCTLQDSSGVGIRVSDSVDCRVIGNDIHDIGAEGIVIAGGDRMTLRRGENQAVNNHVYRIGQISNNAYAVEIDGVGNRVAHNLIHDAPLGGIQFRGNDHLIELNEIHNIGLDGGDLGAIYTNGDWAARGNLIRNNLVHHASNANGVYIDDGHSGARVEGNIFYRIRSGPFIGGGHDNRVFGNLVIECQYGIHLDDRGVARGYTLDRDGVLTRMLRKVNWKQPPWSERYPQLVTMLSKPDLLPVPTGNDFAQNVLAACRQPWELRLNPDYKASNAFDDNVELGDAAEVVEAADKLDLTFVANQSVADTAPAVLKIDARAIGLKIDTWRHRLPDEQLVRRFESRPARQLFDSNDDIDASNKIEARP